MTQLDADTPASTERGLSPRRLVDATPLLAQQLIVRQPLLSEMATALTRRLTVVVADAGFGKSVTLAAWAATVDHVWYGLGSDDASLAALALGLAQTLEPRFPELSRQLKQTAHASLGPEGDESDRAAQLATLLCEALDQHLRDDLALVFDDLHELGLTGPSVHLIEEICRQAPPRLHVVLSSRLEPPFPIQRLRGQGEVLDVDAEALTFCAEEVGELVRLVLGEDAVSLAAAVFELTAGWPAAVRLTTEALRAVPEGDRLTALDGLRRPGGHLFAYVAEEVLARAAPPVRELLRRVAVFERFDPGLCRAIGLSDPSESLVALRRSGLLLEARVDGGGRLGLHTLIREFVRERWPLGDGEFADVHRRAAAWFEEQGAHEDALESLTAIGDHAGVARLLGDSGQQLLAAGKVELTIRIAGQLPMELRTPRLERLLGEAHEIRGEWDEALHCFERAADGSERLDAGLAWRVGMIHHLRGEVDRALEAYERGEAADTAEPREAALLLAWKATAYWLRGDGPACRRAAEEAFERATDVHDAGALAAAHNALAMLAALSGDRLANDAHYLRALDYAQRAGDVVQAVRVRTNRGSRYLEEGEYEEALAELESATRLADLTGFAFFRALALTNRGEVRLRLGHLEEAVADLENARRLYQRTGSRMVSYPLALLGEVYKERGDIAAARALYTEAIAQSEQAGDIQGLVPSLAALAELLASEDQPQAVALAARAVGFGEGMAYVPAKLAAGWVALAGGDHEDAAAFAEDAAHTARLRRDRAGLARALELSALATDDERRRRTRLEEAISLWRGIGDPIGEAHAELLLGAVTGGAAGASLVEDAEARLRGMGARGYRVRLAPVLPSLAPVQSKPLAIATLGRFSVTCNGRPVSHSQWQSKKARDLLKILVARRGRPTPRELLMEALWPEEDPHRLSNRLSVALSTLRGVLDPERRHAPDHFISAGDNAAGLCLVNVEVDVERFLADGEEGLRLYQDHRSEEARALLVSSEALYVGDFLDEDLYEDWATPLREEARATYVAVTTALAAIASGEGDHDAAVRYWLRVLERDPYDEQAHLGVTRALIAAGRHGEARRSYRRYVARMTELDIESSPFPNP